MSSRFFRVPRAEIGYIRMIVESYDGLAFVRSAAAHRNEIEWLIGTGQELAAEQLIRRLAAETGMVEIPCPEDWPALCIEPS